jgi:hypothetical protein
VVTVPAAWVDYVLAALKWRRLIKGISLEQHRGFEARSTPKILAQRIRPDRGPTVSARLQ